MEFEPEPSYEQMESFLVFQVSTSSFQVTIMFFLQPFSGQKNNEFPSSESSIPLVVGFQDWSPQMNKSLSEEVPQILRKLDFHQKMGEIFWWVSHGLRCMAWESDGKLGPFEYFVLEKKGKIAIKKECWKHYCQL